MAKINCIEPLSRVNRVLAIEGLLPSGKARKEIQILKLILHTLFFVTTLFFIIMNGINAIKRGNGKALSHITCIFMPVVNLLMKLTAVLQKKGNFGW